MGRYIRKNPDDEGVRNVGRIEAAVLSAWSHSRNIKEVEPETTVISGQSMNDKPRTPKGYYLDKNSYHDYVNDEGYRIREYVFRKLEPVRIDHRIRRKKRKECRR